MNYPTTRPQLTEAQLNAPLRKRDIQWITQGYAKAIKEFVDSATNPLLLRIDALETRTKNFRYVGTHEVGKQYRLGNFVTHSGSLWHCNSDTQSAPGDGIAWTLCVKRGKDGTDTPRTATSQRGPR